MTMEIFNDWGYLRCSHCWRSFPSLSISGHRSFDEVMKEAYDKGWVTVSRSGYDGGDGKHRAYCPNCADKHKEYRFRYCLKGE